MLYISARLRIHAIAFEPRPHLFVDLYGGYNYLASANGDPTWAYSFSKTPDTYMFSVIHTARLYSSLELGHVR